MRYSPQLVFVALFIATLSHPPDGTGPAALKPLRRRSAQPRAHRQPTGCYASGHGLSGVGVCRSPVCARLRRPGRTGRHDCQSPSLLSPLRLSRMQWSLLPRCGDRDQCGAWHPVVHDRWSSKGRLHLHAWRGLARQSACRHRGGGAEAGWALRPGLGDRRRPQGWDQCRS